MMAKGVENVEVARLLREVADLLELQGANPFRVRAYRGAARSVEELASPARDLPAEGPESLDALPGIGTDLAAKIRKISSSGSLGLLEQLRRRVPKGLPELTRLRGLGPKRASQLRKQLGVRSLADLEHAARAGRVRTLPGFGARTEAKILHELTFRAAAGHRVLRPVAAPYGEALVRYLGKSGGVKNIEIAGSYRRRAESVGDLDVLVTSRTPAPVVRRFVAYPEVEEVLAQGAAGASVRLHSGLQVDLRVLAPESFGAGLYYFTGSKPHNIAVRRLAQARGLKLNEYGAFRGARRIAGRTEEEIARSVGLPWIPPELRENRGEIEAARSGELPELLELGDIRGDLHCHSTDSDGRNSLAAMVRAAEELGYEYLAITDHSPAVRVAGGLDRAGFRRQGRVIDRLNAGRTRLRVLRGAEVDILRDGSLDLDDATLADLELVLVSVHSHFDLSEREQTRRVVRAMRHPAVQVLAHPTGRLIGEREAIRLDREAIYRVACAEGVLLEVNAQPARLDLDDVSARAAVGHGAVLIVNSDAHSVAELAFMRWGVDQARRAWATATDVANTRRLPEFMKLLRRRGEK